MNNKAIRILSIVICCLALNHLCKNNTAIAQQIDGLLSATTINAPANLTALATSSTQIFLGWKDNSTNETGFKIECKTGNCGSANPWRQIAIKPANAITHTVSGLTPNTTYSFRIKAYQSSSNSNYSNCASSKTTATGTPPAPTNFKAISASATKINLTWNDNSTNESGFKVFRKSGTAPWSLRTTTGANIKTFCDTAATNNTSITTYQYHILAYNSLGYSPSTYAATVPYQPINLNIAPGTTNGTVILTWEDKSINETGFEIYRITGTCSSTSTWVKVTTLGANKNTWTDTERAIGSTYSYKIRTFKKIGSILPVYGYSMWSSCSSINVSSSADVFALYPSNCYQPGYLESYNITGSDTAGGKYEGKLSLKTENRITIDGAQITPVTTLFNLKNTVRDVFISQLSKIYYDINRNPIMQTSGSPERTYLPVSVDIFPVTAKIGDFGALTSWICDDGTSMSGNWSLEKNDDSSTKANLVTMITALDEFGKVLVYQEMVKTIAKYGISQTISIQWHYPETGITVNLIAKKAA